MVMDADNAAVCDQVRQVNPVQWSQSSEFSPVNQVNQVNHKELRVFFVGVLLGIWTKKKPHMTNPEILEK